MQNMLEIICINSSKMLQAIAYPSFSSTGCHQSRYFQRKKGTKRNTYILNYQQYNTWIIKNFQRGAGIFLKELQQRILGGGGLKPLLSRCYIMGKRLTFSTLWNGGDFGKEKAKENPGRQTNEYYYITRQPRPFLEATLLYTSTIYT